MNRDFEQTLATYGPLLSRVASSYEANHDLQKELLQEICLAVWQALSKFRGDSSEKTFILRVAHNRAVSHVSYHSKIPFQQAFSEDESGVNADIATSSRSPEVSEQRDREVAHLLAAVRELPIQTRQVVTLSMEGLSYRDIANVCGLTTTNVGVLLNRARKTLSEKIEYAG